MRIHWYWPYSHEGGRSPYVDATARYGDEVTVQALSTRFGRPLANKGPYEVVRDLPEANRGEQPPNAVVRASSRAQIYAQRALARRRLVSSRDFEVSVQHHLNHYVDALALRDLARKVPLVSFVHDVFPHEPRLPTTVERQLLSTTYRNAGHLIVYHRVLRDALITEFGIDPDRVHVVPHPLTLRASEEQRVVDGPCRFLFFGNFRPNKGLPLLLEALELLGPRDDFTVHIAGRGQRPIVDQVAQVAERFPHVSLETGFIPRERKEELFTENDVMVLPYTSFASQSGVLADAYSFGLPLIVTDVGAIGPTVRDDQSGLVVKPGSAQELATALDRVAGLGSQRTELRRAALRAAESHSFEAVGSSLRSVLETATIQDRT